MSSMLIMVKAGYRTLLLLVGVLFQMKGVYNAAYTVWPCFLMVPDATGLKIACTITPEGKGARLTCTFDEDIGAKKYSFNVQRYEHDPTDHIPDIILGCAWFHTGLKCDYNESLYHFDNHVTNEIVLMILEMREEHDGRYLCQIIGTSRDTVDPCNYQNAAIKQDQLATTPHVPGQSGDTASSSAHVHGYLIAIIVLVALVVLVTVTVLSVFIGRKSYNRRSRRRPNAETNEEVERVPMTHRHRRPDNNAVLT